MQTPLYLKTGIRCCAFTLAGAVTWGAMTDISIAESRVPLLARDEVPTEIAQLYDKLLADRKIVITLDDKARHWLGNAGYDPVYGARPLKRALQRMVQDPLAIKILNGEVLHGAHVRIGVDRKSNQLSFEAMGKEAMA